MNNQKRGKDFEQRFVKYLQSIGCWVHFIQPSPDGSQPFDIIAGKNNILSAFDCKTLDGNRFPLSRVEDNQRMAFQLLNKKGNMLTYFAVEVSENVVKFIPSIHIEKAIKEGKKSITMNEYANISIK